MRFFIAGGGCYGSYYLRQLDRARTRGKLKISEIWVVDKNPDCAVSKTLSQVEGAKLFVGDWCDFGKQVRANWKAWKDDMWVPTPIGPHIVYEWVVRDFASRFQTSHVSYTGDLPKIDFAQTTPTGQAVLSHAPGVCPTNCVEPVICPLTKDTRDWEMRDTVKAMVGANPGIQEVGVFVCQHYAHGVGTIPIAEIQSEWTKLEHSVGAGGARVAVATVSSCHGLVDVVDILPLVK